MPKTSKFTLNDLSWVRRVVRHAARGAGLTATRTDNLVVAVNEVAANAVLHGGGEGCLTVDTVADGLVVEVHDEGPGLPAEVANPTDRRPSLEAVGGRGLWMARHLCAGLTTSGPPGLTVRMYMPRA